jgi:hypothetical protein
VAGILPAVEPGILPGGKTARQPTPLGIRKHILQSHRPSGRQDACHHETGHPARRKNRPSKNPVPSARGLRFMERTDLKPRMEHGFKTNHPRYSAIANSFSVFNPWLKIF